MSMFAPDPTLHEDALADAAVEADEVIEVVDLRVVEGDVAGASGAEAGAVAELQGQVGELQDMVKQLLAQTTSTITATYDPDVSGASRTLRFAKMTADEVLTEAHDAAAAIVAAAERRRDELEAETRRQSERVLAESAERIAAASAEWETQRVELLGQIRGLAGAVARYQAGFVKLDAALHGAVTELIGQRGDGVADALPTDALPTDVLPADD